MDATTSGTQSLHCHNLPDQPVSSAAASPPVTPFQRQKRQYFGDSTPGEFPLAANPSIVLHVLTECRLDPRDLANLEATCSFFSQPANFAPDCSLSLPELAALDMCNKRMIFKPMSEQEREEMKRRCGGSWKLVLRFLLAGEACCRREKSQAIAGPGHSIAVTSKGQVYTFGHNNSGQLGHGHTDEEARILPIRSLQGTRIIQAAAGAGRTMLISDNGSVYACGKDLFGEAEYGGQGGSRQVTTPQLVTSLKNIFVVQAAIGNFFTAVLSREGKVYTFSWGSDGRLGHQTEANDVEPRPLLGSLENVPVVQIAAGYCYLLALVCQPNGMSVYSVGCGLGGKLGHGLKTDEKYPRVIEQFQLLNFQPRVVAAGAWHAAVVGQDGRVCTWGWGRYGCLGHGNEEGESVPKVVEGLSHVKAVHVATGDYTTFVVSEDGDVYSFGCGESASLGHHTAVFEQRDRQANVLSPAVVTSLKQVKGGRLLGKLPSAANKEVNCSRVKLNWLKRTFSECPEDASSDVVKCHTRAYLLYLIGSTIFATTDGDKVSVKYLPLFEDFDRAGRYAWGAAALACLYRALGNASLKSQSNICGCLTLLQCWSYFHLDIGRPEKAEASFPLALLWKGKGSRSKTDLSEYRRELDDLDPTKICWCPYERYENMIPPHVKAKLSLGRSKTTLVCFEKIELHFPDRCLRQFGKRQPIPQKVKRRDRKNRRLDDLDTSMTAACEEWAERGDHIVDGPGGGNVVDDGAYMEWYARISITKLNREAFLENQVMNMIACMREFEEAASGISMERLSPVEREVMESVKDTFSSSLTFGGWQEVAVNSSYGKRRRRNEQTSTMNNFGGGSDLSSLLLQKDS